ncbi:hypothetical protein FB45DRAFT_1081810 [Roridomyces roridus]|uniref:Uncharacterized protein n=1 Tax=Roridomyces roridus TaxID=1738132 RepID=A0AAD7FJ49_9AGAR|nr:hypothetical protein FB45DRAFT_1081810 [Roridomyces roridus]
MEILPLLLHASLICFYVGLVAFLIPVNHSIMILSGCILALMVIVYVVLTILPLVYLDCPHQTPLSTAFLQIFRRIRTLSHALLPTEGPPVSARDTSMVNLLTKRATADCAERDYRALCWMMLSLADDDELEPFVEGIPDVLWGAKGRRNAYDEHFKFLLRDRDVRHSSPINKQIRNLRMENAVI